MVSPTPHQSNPHVACRTYGDRRSPRTRAATVRDRSGTGWSCIHFGIERHAAARLSRSPYRHGRHSTLPTFTDPRNPLRLPKYKRRI